MPAMAGTPAVARLRIITPQVTPLTQQIMVTQPAIRPTMQVMLHTRLVIPHMAVITAVHATHAIMVATPAAGTTTNPPNNNSPTPTTTFKSTEPTVNPNAGENTNNNSNSNPNYEPSNNDSGFEMPEREKKTEDNNAPPFNFNSSRDALKVPSAPMVPVEQVNPEPTQLEEFRAPRLDLIPAPVAVDDSQISWSVTKAPTRVARNARYSIPTVARYTPAQLNELVPPMPIQVAEK